MAIKKDFSKTDQNLIGSLSAKDAYWKIVKFSGNKTRCDLTVDVYKEQNNGFIESQSFSFEPSMNGGNFIKQGYEHLKTLPEFAGAVDC
jgi:hypothetical protein